MAYTGGRFYQAMALTFIAIALIGFAPTFYLRGYLPLPSGFASLTPLIAAHGVVATLWLILFALQTFLVALRRVDLHRRLGMASLAIAVAMVILGTLATLNGFRRGAALNGVDPRVWWLGVTFPGVPVFAGFVGAAYACRRRAQVHRRLMLIATMNLIPPAVARFVLRNFGSELTMPIGLTVTALMLGAMAAHELWATRRVHPALIAGAVITLLVPMVAPILAATEPALALADLFR